ncbi:unnamed protein product [Urochloa decumbens]|uniref:Uncharacterized protein n=1 Tax=Urochloa decumbens TaxID=240449 RepID=A0ABC8WHB7_9POAL
MLAAVRRRHLSFPLGALAAAAFSSTAAANPSVSYLISRCGLSPASAAPSVLALLPGRRRAGGHPKTLQPKLDFLASVGVSAPLLPRLISVTPILLHSSVEDHLAPLFATLREVLGGSDNRVVAVLRLKPFVARCKPKTTLLRGLPLLRDVHGLSADEVASLVALQPSVIMLTPDRINEIVDAVRGVGVEPGSPKFAYVFAVFTKMKATTLESKIAYYRRLGFDSDSITKMIQRHPASMAVSEKKISEIVGFLTGKAGLSLEDIVAYPYMLVRSLENLSRRCAVFAVLARVGKRPGQLLPLALMSSSCRFLKMHVQPHADELPDVRRAMKGEIPFDGFGGSEEKPKGVQGRRR